MRANKSGVQILCKFDAEIKKVEARKMASLDIIYRLFLETDNQQILELGKLPSDTLIKVEISV